MGLLGAGILGSAGNMAGRALATKYMGDKYANEGANIGTLLGSAAGSAIPFFKNGGKVKGKKNKPVLAILHGGEVVIPIGVKVTKSQKSAIEKRKKIAKKEHLNCFV